MTSTDVVKAPDGKTQPRRSRRTPGTPRGSYKYDWPAIRAAYVEGVKDEDGNRTWPTQQAVADLFEMKVERIKERASKERWTEQKAAFSREWHEERQKKRQKELVAAALDVDSKSINVARLGLALVTKRIAEIAKESEGMAKRAELINHYIDNGLKIPDKLLQPTIDAREMVALAQAAQGYQQLGLKALGEDVQRVEVTGRDGGAVQIEVRKVADEVMRDDNNRLAALLNASAELQAQLLGEMDIEDADIVEDEEDDEIDQIDPAQNGSSNGLLNGHH